MLLGGRPKTGGAGPFRTMGTTRGLPSVYMSNVLGRAALCRRCRSIPGLGHAPHSGAIQNCRPGGKRGNDQTLPDVWRIADARRDIFDEWQFATDPANLQPKVRPVLRAAAAHLRKFAPPDLAQEEIDGVIDAVEAPWGIRIEKQIREALASADGVDASRRIVETVRQLGLEPFRAPEPLPPIEEEDVRLICWLAVDSPQ